MRNVDPILRDIEQYLQGQEKKMVLRFLACGGAGDGTSTLIGRLISEAGLVCKEPVAASGPESNKAGTQNGALDFRPLPDGLTPDQGITNDVAYRLFSTQRRNYVVADTSGHDRYTRNIIAGASTAEVGLVLVDARNGVLTETRRNSYLVSVLGIRKVVLAVNKLDLVGYAKQVFDGIEAEFRRFADRIGLGEVDCIPISALIGDNVTAPSPNIPWYRGPTLMEYLETVDATPGIAEGSFRMPVQWVDHAHLGSRGFAGRIVGGTIAPGQRVRVLPLGKESTVARVATADGDLGRAVKGQSVTLTLADEVAASRGDLVCAADAPASVADQFEATIIWVGDEDMLPGRPYVMKIGARTVGAALATPKYKTNVDTLEHLAARTLAQDDIGVCNLNLDQPVPFDPYRENRDTGGFILIDRLTNATVGAGLLHFALRRSQNIHWQAIEVNKDAHAALKQQRPCIVWFTGLSGAGKSTIANVLEKKLHALGRHTYLLDGDNVRHGLNKDLGFTEADRVENIRRVAELARLMVDAGLIVLVSFISPFRAERRMARALVSDGEFYEVFVDTPLSIAEQRDTKGLYRKARQGQLKNFTGIDSPYEPPEHAEMRIDTTRMTAEEAAETIVAHLHAARMLERGEREA